MSDESDRSGGVKVNSGDGDEGVKMKVTAGRGVGRL